MLRVSLEAVGRGYPDVIILTGFWAIVLSHETLVFLFRSQAEAIITFTTETF